MSICYIVGAGENYGLAFKKEDGDYVIAADGGFRYLQEAGTVPDMVVGDFDTLKYIPQHPNVIRLNPVKDVTDTWEAVRLGMEKGYKEFHLFGCMGGRTEHSMANIQLLTHIAEEGCKGYLHAKSEILTVIINGSIEFNESMNGFVSVFSLSDKSSGVTLEGLKYKMTDGELKNNFPLGVSNEFIGSKALIKVKEGCLLIVFPKE